MKKSGKQKMKKKKSKLEKNPCPHCSYKFRHLHGGECPMCKHCASCGHKLHSCKCLEGE